MDEIQIFKNEEFGEVRTLLVNNEPYFVGRDVAAILGYQNPRKAIIDHVDNEDKTDGVTIRDSIGREQNPIIINESGLYSLILSSKLPTAKAFKRWVTHEVLPTIRKTGGYIATKDADTDDDIMARAKFNLRLYFNDGHKEADFILPFAAEYLLLLCPKDDSILSRRSNGYCSSKIDGYFLYPSDNIYRRLPVLRKIKLLHGVVHHLLDSANMAVAFPMPTNIL